MIFKLTLFLGAFAIAACAKSPPPHSTKAWQSDNEICGVGPTAHVCPVGTHCAHDEPPLLDADAEAPPRGPSGSGEGCGGVAGFHCATGLVCEMPADQENVADGMGTCVTDSRCLKLVQGCFGVAASCPPEVK